MYEAVDHQNMEHFSTKQDFKKPHFVLHSLIPLFCSKKILISVEALGTYMSISWSTASSPIFLQESWDFYISRSL